MYRALVDRAVAIEAYGYAIAAKLFVGPGDAGCRRHTAAHDGVGAGDADGLVVQVHGTAASAAAAVREAHDFLQQYENVRLHFVGQPVAKGIETLGRHGAERLGQVLVMGAVCAAEPVGSPYCKCRTDGDGFLAHAGMDRAVDQAVVLEFQDLLLERSNDLHLVQHPEHLGTRNGLHVFLFSGQRLLRRLDIEVPVLHCLGRV